MDKACWNCGKPAPSRFCPECGALQPPASDYYTFFEIPRTLNLDLQALEKRFYALSRQLHPDLFSRKSAREQEYSLEATAVLNDGYRVLKDPLARAGYVLKQEGFDVGSRPAKMCRRSCSKRYSSSTWLSRNCAGATRTHCRNWMLPECVSRRCAANWMRKCSGNSRSGMHRKARRAWPVCAPF